MILIVEIVLLIYGIYALISGKYTTRRGKVVLGDKARALGCLAMLPIPIAMGAGFVLGLFFVLIDQPFNLLFSTALEIFILIVVLLILFVLSERFYKEQESANPE